MMNVLLGFFSIKHRLFRDTYLDNKCVFE